VRECFRKLVWPILRLDKYLKERNARNFKRMLSEGKMISLLDDGFQIRDPKGKVTLVPWATISSINAFQVDLFTLDMICVEFYQDDGSRIEINEHMEGYQAIMELVRSKFKGFDADWYEKVAFPPLKPNFRELWRKE